MNIGRRELWKFLQRNKKDKIILLTTHSLEEAEFLGDRIGIIKEGEYICSGTSSYLKNKYPHGYNINLLISSRFNYENRQQMLNDLKVIDSTSFIKISSNSLLTINFNNLNGNVINSIFKYIEDSKSLYNINKYTVSTTSLEDVFINLNIKNFSNQLLKIPGHIQVDENNEDKIIENSVSYKNQFYGNFIKNIYVFLKDYSNLIETIILIIFFTISKIFIYEINHSDSLINNSIHFENIFSFKNYLVNKFNCENETSIVFLKRNISNNEIIIYNIYNSKEYNYFQITMNMIISIISEKEFGIYVKLHNNFKFISNSNINFFYYFFLILLIVSFIGNKMQIPFYDRISQLKHILFLNGTNPFFYW